MSWFSSLFSARTQLPDEPATLGVAASADGRRGALLRADGQLHVWDLESGERLLQAPASGPGLALSPTGRFVATGDGVLRDVDQREVLDVPLLHGLPWFVGEELLRVGRGRLWLGRPGEAPRVRLESTGLDPSADTRLVPGPRWWALVDPHLGEGVRLFDPVAGALAQASPGRGPAWSAAWVGERLHVLQEGGIYTWAQDDAPSSAKRPHGLQTLAVAAEGDALHSVGIDAQGRYEWRGPGGEQASLPGKPPSRPHLRVRDGAVAAETWSGFWFRGQGEPVTLTLPRPRVGPRPASLPAGLCWVSDQRALIGLWPPAVYRLRDATCERILQTG
ncbi:MAG: hypothetical protein H6741_15710 [Alphaproteobacteria bacterium]|nr:hypothetical protein [Alphaproteobacteria bacterium]